MSRKTRVRLAVAGSVVVVLAVAGIFGAQQVRSAAPDIPTTKVERGDVELNVYALGELRTPRTSMLVAPPVSGMTLQIVHLAKTGTAVKAGDVIIEFDPSEQQYNLEQARYALDQAEQEITKMKADAAVQAAQDKVALLRARFDVRRAELEVSRNELVSEIDAKKNLLTLEEARRRLSQLEHDVKSREASNTASLAVLEQKRNESRIAMAQAQHTIETMTIRSPINGLVSIKENQDASGGFFFTGMVLPEYREGDLVWPGRTLAEVMETENMEILAKVDENDRSNVNPGQPVEITLDARPGTSYSGKVKNVAGLATRARWGAEALRRFDATFELDKPDPRLRSGETALVVVRGNQMKDALSLPRQALFEKDGKPVVYVKRGNQFEAVEAKVKFRTESRVVLEGLAEGTEVALVNPEDKDKRVARHSNGPAMGGAQ